MMQAITPSDAHLQCPHCQVTGENHIQLQLPHEDVSKEIKKLQFYHFHVKT